MHTTQEYQLVVLRPEGRLDQQGSKILEQEMANISQQPRALWVIDLAQVDFMDSSGLVALVTGLKAARERNCRLVLCNLQTPVKLVLELTQLDSVFEIFSSYDAVIATVNNAAFAV